MITVKQQLPKFPLRYYYSAALYVRVHVSIMYTSMESGHQVLLEEWDRD